MKIIAIPFLLAALTTSAFADLTLSQKIEQEGGKEGEQTITLKIKDGKVRMDAGTQASTIIDIKTGDMQTLMHNQKMVMAVPGAMVKAMQQMAQKQGDAGAGKVEVPKATGRKETINGYACEEYEMTASGSKVTMWLTKDLPEAESMLKQMAALSPENNIYAGMAEDHAISGFPMRSTIVGTDGKTTSVSVVGLSLDPLPAADFAAPSGYKPVAMPAIPGR